MDVDELILQVSNLAEEAKRNGQMEQMKQVLDEFCAAHEPYVLIAVATRVLLTAIGEDVTREGLIDTPDRVARFWTAWMNFNPGNVETLFESAATDQLVVVRGIEGYSLCEHHLLPWRFSCTVGYLTGEQVIGLSKVPRIVHKHAHSLQLQERMTNQIADEVEEVCKPRGVAVVVRGWHSCSQMRGIKARESSMYTSCMRGVLLANPVARQEFFSLAGEV
jgi:GTP cyclohydrolase I